MNKVAIMVYSAILDKGEEGYTLLSMVFKAIENRQIHYNFLINNVDAYPEKKYDFILGKNIWISGNYLTEIIKENDFQWIWGFLAAFPQNITKENAINSAICNIDDYGFLNANLQPNSLEYSLADFIIFPFDSSGVIIKSKNKSIIDSFIKNKPLAMDYEKY